ncbi:hypothetical protein CCB80_05185 [Armatimonadetes bacterium Uphvl-Ar1]|nr:hypothetical protein CCB80_05185 [Armatimonadetes bacterium Uphvl-Ar1]
MKQPVVVIGAGAAGIIASHTLATQGVPVLLLEKTDRIGTKILISGGGKCNITHDGPIELVLKAFRKNEANFIRPACYRFLNTRIIDMLTERGLRVYTRPDGRIFPVDQTAKDVVRILHTYLDEAGVKIKFHSPVTEIVAPGGRISAVRTETDLIPTEHVILCTGGSSYPRSGTTGDGFPWAKTLGHTIVPIRAALAPMEIGLKRQAVKAGVSLRNIILKARVNNKEIARWQGDLLFTHHGVSGPCALGISREVSDHWHTAAATLEIDLLPTVKLEEFQNDLQTFKAQKPNHFIRPIVEEFVPNSVAPFILAVAEIPEDARAQAVSKKQLNILAQTMKFWQIGEVEEVILDKGEVVAGGVSLEEVDNQTMRSQIVQGLYLAGEVLDIAGPVGGYNLQAAWATGFVAGDTAAQDWLS